MGLLGIPQELHQGKLELHQGGLTLHQGKLGLACADGNCIDTGKPETNLEQGSVAVTMIGDNVGALRRWNFWGESPKAKTGRPGIKIPSNSSKGPSQYYNIDIGAQTL